jgi:hypothetical protein
MDGGIATVNNHTDDRVKEQGYHAVGDNRALVTLDLWIERNPQWAQQVPREIWEDLVFALEATYNAAIAAEREHYQEAVRRFEQAASDSYETYQQLLHAQATIAELKRQYAWIKIDVDLSALDKFKKDTERMDWLDKCTDKPDGFWTEFNSYRDIRELIDTTIELMKNGACE